jgi:hypothetical protein
MANDSPSDGLETAAPPNDWLSGPNQGYGFGSSRTPNRPVEEHRQSIRVFLSMINPDTGYIGDD